MTHRSTHSATRSTKGSSASQAVTPWSKSRKSKNLKRLSLTRYRTSGKQWASVSNIQSKLRKRTETGTHTKVKSMSWSQKGKNLLYFLQNSPHLNPLTLGRIGDHQSANFKSATDLNRHLICHSQQRRSSKLPLSNLTTTSHLPNSTNLHRSVFHQCKSRRCRQIRKAIYYLRRGIISQERLFQPLVATALSQMKAV